MPGPVEDLAPGRSDRRADPAPLRCLALSGYVYDGDTPLVGERAGAYVAAALRRATPDLPDGSFAAVVQEGARLHLMTDRVGTRALYHGWDGHRWHAATDFWQVADALPARTPDPRSAAQLLTYNHTLGSRTLIAQVHEALPGSVTTLEPDGSTRTRTCWTYDTRPAARFDPDAAAAELAGILRDAAGRTARLVDALGIGTVGVSLTAGLDSRLVAWMLASHDVPIHALTTRLAGEEVVAAQVAGALGASHTSMDLWSGEPDPAVTEPLLPVAMYGICNHVLTLAENGPWPLDGFASGHLGDLVAGSHLDVRSLAAAATGPAETARLLHRKHSRFPLPLLEQVLDPAHRPCARAAHADLGASAAGVDAGTAWGLEKRIGTEQRQHKLVLRDHQSLAVLGHALLPLHDRAWLDWSTRVPLRWQTGTGLYTRALTQHLFTGRWSALREIPANGRRVDRPGATTPELSAARALGAQVAGQVRLRLGRLPAQSRLGDTPCEGLEDAAWLLRPDAVREHWGAMNEDNRRAVDTVVRFSRRLARSGARPATRPGDPRPAH